jgi:hypothetical protein
VMWHASAEARFEENRICRISTCQFMDPPLFT